MTSRSGKKSWPSIYTPEEQEKLRRWKERKRRKCMVYIGSAVQHWKEVKAEERIRKDKDLALFLLQLYWKFFKPSAKPSSGMDVPESGDCSSSELNEDSSDSTSPSMAHPAQLPPRSIPRTAPSSIDCKEAPELGEVTECPPELAVFTTTDPLYRSEHLDNLQTQERSYGNCETDMVPEATQEEVVETFIQIEEETFISTQEHYFHPMKNEHFHPIEGEELHPIMREHFHMIEEEAYNSNEDKDLHEDIHPIEEGTFSVFKEEELQPIKKEKVNPIEAKTATEHNGCSKYQKHNPILPNVCTNEDQTRVIENSTYPAKMYFKKRTMFTH